MKKKKEESRFALIYKLCRMLLFFKFNFNIIELQMKFDISNVEFHLKIYIELDFIKIEFKKQ